jgi:hypothetical protein
MFVADTVTLYSPSWTPVLVVITSVVFALDCASMLKLGGANVNEIKPEIFSLGLDKELTSAPIETFKFTVGKISTTREAPVPFVRFRGELALLLKS